MLRGRVRASDRPTAEWRSELVPRYQRRSGQFDAAILGVYLSGTNTRRIKGALAPLLRGAPLSKDAVSRLVGRLREDFAAWAQRDLGELKIRYLFLDGWYPRVRIGKKRGRVPVLVTLGVCANVHRGVLDLRRAGDGQGQGQQLHELVDLLPLAIRRGSHVVGHDAVSLGGWKNVRQAFEPDSASGSKA